MGTSRTLLTRHLLLACSFGAWLVCVNAQADGTGEIVITRHVYPRAVGSIVPPPDPNPTTVNANPAAQINAVTTHGELGMGTLLASAPVPASPASSTPALAACRAC